MNRTYDVWNVKKILCLLHELRDMRYLETCSLVPSIYQHKPKCMIKNNFLRVSRPLSVYCSKRYSTKIHTQQYFKRGTRCAEIFE